MVLPVSMPGRFGPVSFNGIADGAGHGPLTSDSCFLVRPAAQPFTTSISTSEAPVSLLPSTFGNLLLQLLTVSLCQMP